MKYETSSKLSMRFSALHTLASVFAAVVLGTYSNGPVRIGPSCPL